MTSAVQKTEFLDARFTRVRYWLWEHFHPDGRRRQRFRSMRMTYAQHMRHLTRVQEIQQCLHTDTRPNPDAIAVLDRDPRVCLDCGVGIATWHRKNL